jgi:hypothetical protein
MLEPGEPGAPMPHDPLDTATAAELDALCATCWRQQQEIRALSETVAILRGGANRLAAETATLQHALTAAHRLRGFRGRGRSRSRCLRRG